MEKEGRLGPSRTLSNENRTGKELTRYHQTRAAAGSKTRRSGKANIRLERAIKRTG